MFIIFYAVLSNLFISLIETTLSNSNGRSTFEFENKMSPIKIDLTVPFENILPKIQFFFISYKLVLDML